MSVDELAPTAVADRVALTLARTITRRRLLRNAGGAALALSLGGAFLGKPDVARASYGCYDPNGPCGPSPICNGLNCSGGECGSGMTRRTHDNFDCSGASNNCWSTHCECGSTWAGLWSCCDCCASNGGGNHCGSCGYACICRSVIGSC